MIGFIINQNRFIGGAMVMPLYIRMPVWVRERMIRKHAAVSQ